MVVAVVVILVLRSFDDDGDNYLEIRQHRRRQLSDVRRL